MIIMATNPKYSCRKSFSRSAKARPDQAENNVAVTINQDTAFRMDTSGIGLMNSEWITKNTPSPTVDNTIFEAFS